MNILMAGVAPCEVILWERQLLFLSHCYAMPVRALEKPSSNEKEKRNALFIPFL